MRTLSHSELARLTDCMAAWDLAYSDHLAGSSLTPLVTAPILREGRAWGRGVATWHQTGLLTDATAAIQVSVDEDAEEMVAAGVDDPDGHQGMTHRLTAMLDHYTRHTTRLPITEAEHPFDVGIPSRTGVRASTRYRLTGQLDGVHRDQHGRTWITEFKLRRTLTPLEQLVLDRQGRRYAWAWWRETGEPVAGVIYDERLNDHPRPPKVLANGRTSHDKRQVTTDHLYLESCRDTGTTPDAETAAHLAGRAWQQRHVITFRPGELQETGRELVTLARLIGDLESGRLDPVRAPSTRRCNGCFYRAACPNPGDRDVIDLTYRRVPAKRHRQEAAA